jgi:hypothetical protein
VWLTSRAEEFRPVALLILDEMRDRLLEVLDADSVEILSRSLAMVKDLSLDQDR